MENEVLFGNLCIQENLCTNVDIENAIKTQKRLRRIGVQKKLGEILISKGIISAAQLESIIKIQYKLYQTDEEAVLGQLALNNEIISHKQLETAQNILKNKFKEDSSKPHSLIDVLIELGFADKSKLNSLNKLYNQVFGKERQFAFCAHCHQIVENIKGQCGICGKTLPPLSRRGDTKIFRLMPEAEPVGQQDTISDRLNIVTKSDESTSLAQVRQSTRMEARDSTQLKELPENISILRRFWIPAAFLIVGVLIGLFVRFYSTPKVKTNSEAKSAENAESKKSDKLAKIITADDLVPYRDLTNSEKITLLRALGFTQVSDGRWLPKSYVREYQLWQKRKGVDLLKLNPFELDGKRFFAFVNKINSSTYMLEFADGTTKDYPAIVILGQIQVFNKYKKELGRREFYDDKTKFYEELGDFCDANGWHIEARNNYVLAFINNPEKPSIRKKLKFILPGEAGTDVDSQIFMPEIVEIPINPALPSVNLDIPLQKDLDVDFKPKTLDWKRLSMPITAADFVNEDVWNVDIERKRMNEGEALYLGYWLKADVLEDWRKRLRSFRKTNLENDVLVASEEFQINNEILNSARILYQLSKNYFGKDGDRFLGNKTVNVWRNLEKKFLIFIVTKDTDLLKYQWLSSRYNVIFVEIEDLRKLENLIFPLLRAFFHVFLEKSNLKAVTGWVEEGMQSEFAFNFIKNNKIVFQRSLILAKAFETWRRMSSDDIENIHSIYDNVNQTVTRDVAQMCWGIVRALNSSDLDEKLFLTSDAEDIPTKTLVFLNEFKKLVNEIHTSLNYDCVNGQKSIRETVKLNRGNVEFLSPAFCGEMEKGKNGLFVELKISQNIEKFSALELWILIGLSACFDEIQFGTLEEKTVLKKELLEIFADKPAFLKLITNY